ncbi:uncharacterized protein LOC111258606 isoform X2 [Varroa jacobsoni]|uniref:E3 ubiquitin-protein ligase E3D n=1 Tax=Varroa destructor TaxID=109461 RepID=A0A7M7JEW8_VARDE|nr:uncharacterized protein LOC111245268 isoform X2 [Varroa destructor]XP_022686074.1 uncharacterized protein LOC111258606 isoform X2 [Varroa jacobsoni]
MYSTSPLQQPLLNSVLPETATASQCKLNGIFLMEFRPRHNICTFSVRSNITCIDIEVRLQPKQIEFYFPYKEESICFQMPPFFQLDLRGLSKFDTDHTWTTLEDGTLSSIYSTSSGLTFIKCRMINPPDTPVPSVFRGEFEQASNRFHDIRCEACLSSMLKKPVLFRRILPCPNSGLCPSENDFFCHPVHENGRNCQGQPHENSGTTTPNYRVALEEAANAEEAAYAERDAAKAVAALRIVQTVVTVAATRTVCTKDNSQDTGNLPLGPVETVLSNDKRASTSSRHEEEPKEEKRTCIEDPYSKTISIKPSYSALQLSSVTLKKRFVKNIVSTSNATQGEEEEASIAKYPNENVKDVDLVVNTGSILKQTVRIKQEDGHLQVSLPDISEYFTYVSRENERLANVKQKPITLDASELFFTVNKFVVDEEILSDDVAKQILGDSILCPECKIIVGVTTYPRSQPVKSNSRRVSFYRVRVLLENCENQEVIAKLSYQQLIARLLRQLIAYKFQVRLFLMSESSPDVLVIWVMESDILVYDSEISFEPDTEKKQIHFKRKHKVLFTKTLRNASYIQHFSNAVTVLKQVVLQDTLDLIYEQLGASTKSNFFREDESNFEGHEIGYIDALA